MDWSSEKKEQSFGWKKKVWMISDLVENEKIPLEDWA